MNKLLLVVVLAPVFAFADGIPMIDGWIQLIESTPEASIIVIAGVVDFVFRLVKSDKPRSIAWFLHGLAKQLAALLQSVASFLDKVLPQRLNS